MHTNWLLASGFWLLASGGAWAGGGTGSPEVQRLPDLSGVWMVTAKYSDGSCPDVTSGSRTLTWTVNRATDGTYDVQAVGAADPFTERLIGREEGDRIALYGYVIDERSNPEYHGRWLVQGDSDRLQGQFFTVASTPRNALPTFQGGRVWTTRFLVPGGGLPCATVWTVEMIPAVARQSVP